MKVSKDPHYWLGDTRFAVSFRVEIDDIVAAVVVPAMHQHRVKDVVGRVLGVSLLEKLIQWQLFRELKPAGGGLNNVSETSSNL